MTSPGGAICEELSISLYTPDTPSLPVCLKYVLTHFKREFLKTLHAFLLSYEDSHTCVILTVWSEYFEGVIALFDSK